MPEILLIGNGAREHVIAETLKKSRHEPHIISYMKAKNPGIAALSQEFEIGDYSDIDLIKKFAKREEPDFAFIGPEEPLSHGVADMLEGIGIPCIGPKKELARLETSKSFARELLREFNIEGNPRYKIFDKNNIKNANDFINSVGDAVVKPDGLTWGKGVKVQGDHFSTKKEGLDYCTEVLKTHPRVIIEEKLDGEEFSLQCITDGKTVLAFPPVQDHKRAFDGDKGPNCYSSDTEILTENGWKTFDKLKKNEKVMTFNPKKTLLEFRKPENIYWMKHKGKMIHFKHRELDLLVTPNHRMLIKPRRSNRIKISFAKNIKGENEIFLTGKWKGKSPKYFVIDEHDYKFNRILKKQKIKFSDWLRFMGLFLSEGYITNKKGERRVYICQIKKSKYFNEFRKILSKLPYNFSYEEKDYKFRINSIQLVNILKYLGSSREKYIPDYVKNAKKEHILQFLRAFVMGDGSIHYGRMRFHSGSKRLIDDIQELVLKIGKSGIITIDKRRRMLNPINKKYYKANKVYSLEIKPETKAGIRKKDIKEVGYNGYVGCVTVPNSFVVVRRNRRIAISGNTGGMGSYTDENNLLPFLTKKDVEDGLKITQKVANALHRKTGQYYKGIMYAGLIATKDGAKLIEYNARFGDPEAMNVLPILKNDLVELCNAVINQKLGSVNLEFEKKATVCKYVVPEGYPDAPVKNQKIQVGKMPYGARIYYASVEQKENVLHMTASRAAACVGIADNLSDAEQIAEKAVSSINGRIFHRSDIGTEKLIKKRIEHMGSISK